MRIEEAFKHLGDADVGLRHGLVVAVACGNGGEGELLAVRRGLDGDAFRFAERRVVPLDFDGDRVTKSSPGCMNAWLPGIALSMMATAARRRSKGFSVGSRIIWWKSLTASGAARRTPAIARSTPLDFLRGASCLGQGGIKLANEAATTGIIGNISRSSFSGTTCLAALAHGDGLSLSGIRHLRPALRA